MKRIILTGGGTAGHVTPNIALIPRLLELGYDIQYIGSYQGIEKELIQPFGIPYHGISSGKLRRYFSVQNFTDPFRVVKGVGEAKRLIKELLPGSPIRQELLSGNRIAAMDLCHFSADKPVILVIGGSLGSVAVNNAVRLALPELLEHFQIVHLCGKGKVDDSLTSMKGYTQFEYIKDELRDIFALADIVISRAGANAICELLALRKPNLLIPLSANASRGDQILNARSFERQGFSMVLEEEELTKESLLEAVRKLYNDRSRFMDAMRDSNQQNSIDTIIDLIENSRR